MSPLRIATRGSPLARWQAEHVARLLAPRAVELVLVRTEGDRSIDASLAAIGGRGVFTKEIQLALLRGDADIAVHSLKDLPTEAVAGLLLAAVPVRGPTGDVFVSVKHTSFASLPLGARVATGSPRRRALLWNRRPDLQLVDIRGNVDTRLRKLETENFDALILAEAGLIRLGFADRVTEVLDQDWFVPAVGQGALAIECRADDATTQSALQPLDDANSRLEVLAERAVLRGLGGGCQAPIAASAKVSGDLISVRAAVLSADGRQRMDNSIEGTNGEAESLGATLAQRLIAQGALKL